MEAWRRPRGWGPACRRGKRHTLRRAGGMTLEMNLVRGDAGRFAWAPCLSSLLPLVFQAGSGLGWVRMLLLLLRVSCGVDSFEMVVLAFTSTIRLFNYTSFIRACMDSASLKAELFYSSILSGSARLLGTHIRMQFEWLDISMHNSA